MLMINGFFHIFIFLLTTFAVVYISLNISFLTSFIPVIGYSVFYLFSVITNYTDKTMALSSIYWNFSLTLVYFSLLMLIVYTIEHNIHQRMDRLAKEEEEAEKKENELRLRNKNQIVSNMQIERDYDNMITLYETIQNMSGTLESENIIGIYVDTMIALVPLFRGTIVLFAEQEEGSTSNAGDRYFSFHSVPHSSGAAQIIEDKRKSPFEGFIVQYKKDPKEFYFEPAERDKYAPYGIRKLEHPMIVLPIKSDKFVIGVVIVEGSQKRYMEQLKTITTFLGIEVKKTNLYEKVRRLSVNDGLTGLFLRRYFTKRIQDTFSTTPESDPPLSLLIVDVDKFKDVNDRYGHQAGDLVLKEVAGILESNARGIDLVCRFGGDEFSVGLPNTTKQEALQIAERLRLTIESSRIAFENMQLRTSVSIGVAAYPEDGQDFDTLFSHADLALYAAKNTGSNRVLSFRKAFLK